MGLLTVLGCEMVLGFINLLDLFSLIALDFVVLMFDLPVVWICLLVCCLLAVIALLMSCVCDCACWFVVCTLWLCWWVCLLTGVCLYVGLDVFGFFVDFCDS